ncbi:MAG: hypothetical protein KAR20_19995, partial [Candidatus Heimdallarchaeota archaeon]|nr:hypothetical protein [Candidatus Heimdallarchaeota archaeon]
QDNSQNHRSWDKALRKQGKQPFKIQGCSNRSPKEDVNPDLYDVAIFNFQLAATMISYMIKNKTISLVFIITQC